MTRPPRGTAPIVLLVLIVGLLAALFVSRDSTLGSPITMRSAETAGTNAYTPEPAGTEIPPSTAKRAPDTLDGTRGEPATVARVIDGDTIEVRQNGIESDVRVLGIDTPETVHPNKPVQCYGPEASAEAKRMLPIGSPVTLHFEGKRTDYYGRLLAYVETEARTDVSAWLAGQGFARVYPLKHDYAVDRTPALLDAQAKAKAEQLGLWGGVLVAGRVLAERRFSTDAGKGSIVVSDRDPCSRVRIVTADGTLEVEGRSFVDALMQLARVFGLADQAMKSLADVDDKLRRRERAKARR